MSSGPPIQREDVRQFTERVKAIYHRLSKALDAIREEAANPKVWLDKLQRPGLMLRDCLNDGPPTQGRILRELEEANEDSLLHVACFKNKAMTAHQAIMALAEFVVMEIKEARLWHWNQLAEATCLAEIIAIQQRLESIDLDEFPARIDKEAEALVQSLVGNNSGTQGNRQEVISILEEIIARLTEDEVGDWWDNIRFLTQRLQAARMGVQIGWQDPYRANPSPTLLIVELPDKWQEQTDPQPGHIEYLRTVARNSQWGTFLMSRDPERTDLSVSAIRTKVNGKTIGNPEQARLKALQAAKQWLRAAERYEAPQSLISRDIAEASDRNADQWVTQFPAIPLSEFKRWESQSKNRSEKQNLTGHNVGPAEQAVLHKLRGRHLAWVELQELVSGLDGVELLKALDILVGIGAIEAGWIYEKSSCGEPDGPWRARPKSDGSYAWFNQSGEEVVSDTAVAISPAIRITACGQLCLEASPPIAPQAQAKDSASPPAMVKAKPKQSANADEKRPARIRGIVAAWRAHHETASGYCTDPAKVADIVRATDISRRTLQRDINAMFGITKGPNTAGWARYESMCQNQQVFLKWLDSIINPSAALALLSPAPKPEGKQCTSCREHSVRLEEFDDQELCPDCYNVAMGKT